MPYTYETFRDYLEFETLQDTARMMGWVDEDDDVAGSRTAQGVYDAITNEVLLQLGYSTPDLVPDGELLEMRALGRIEAWRAVAFNTMADTDLDMGDSTLVRTHIHGNALNQMDLAAVEYQQIFGSPAITVSTPRVSSYAVENEWRW